MTIVSLASGQRAVRFWCKYCVVVQMQIPKGAHYYVGVNGDIASTALVWPTGKKPVRADAFRAEVGQW